MATYAIGDIQGCLSALIRLLEHLQFKPEQDTLWFTGDLVNRGSESLASLRYIKNLGDKHIVVLGNHDLHLLAVDHGAHPGHAGDTLQDILHAPDKDELLDWLKQKPLMHYDANLNFAIVHAGLAPSWDLKTALSLSKEIETVLQSNLATEFFKHMYGNLPDLWSNDLQSFDRLRCITNYFTRLRYCYADGRIDLLHKGALGSQTADLHAWFSISPRANADINIIFGHWAALNGVTNTKGIYAIDTGCVWGNHLTALRLDDGKRFQVSAQTN